MDALYFARDITTQFWLFSLVLENSFFTDSSFKSTF